MVLLDGRAFEAARDTLWQDEGEAIAVLFPDGRPFHRIAQGDIVIAHHDCPPDDYRLRYDFRRWPLWSVRWRVRGPRKDYGAVTLLRPA
jgi:hypothetical protein